MHYDNTSHTRSDGEQVIRVVIKFNIPVYESHIQSHNWYHRSGQPAKKFGNTISLDQKLYFTPKA